MPDWPTNPDQTVHIRTVAQLYGVSIKTVKRLILEGRIPPPEQGRFSWRAGTVIEYKRALEVVERIMGPVAKCGQTPTESGKDSQSDGEPEIPAMQTKKPR